MILSLFILNFSLLFGLLGTIILFILLFFAFKNFVSGTFRRFIVSMCLGSLFLYFILLFYFLNYSLNLKLFEIFYFQILLFIFSIFAFSFFIYSSILLFFLSQELGLKAIKSKKLKNILKKS